MGRVSATSPIESNKRNGNSQKARKSTFSSSPKAKKSTGTNQIICTRAANVEPIPKTRSPSDGWMEAVRQQKARIKLVHTPQGLRKKIQYYKPGCGPRRRKTIQPSPAARKLQPLDVSPIPAVKTEPVDPADITGNPIPPDPTSTPNSGNLSQCDGTSPALSSASCNGGPGQRSNIPLSLSSVPDNSSEPDTIQPTSSTNNTIRGNFFIYCILFVHF